MPWVRPVITKRRVIKVLAVVIGGLILWTWFGPYTNRFRLIIEVETPDGIRSGSSVIQTRMYESGSLLPSSLVLPEARGVRSEAFGEAVFVDLGHNKNVVALLGWGLRGEDEEKIFGLTRAALAPGKDVAWTDEHKLKGRGELPPDYVPTFVTFSNLADPKTARIVPIDGFESTFGPGFRFRRALVETTNSFITRNIQRSLPWWSQPGRPVEVAWRAWRQGDNVGVSIEPERLFVKE